MNVDVYFAHVCIYKMDVFGMLKTNYRSKKIMTTLSQGHSVSVTDDMAFHSTALMSDPMNTTDCPTETENLCIGLNQDGMFLPCTF